MSDLIRREDVVEALYQAIQTTLTGTFTDSMSLAIAMANNIPSVELEQKKGRWIEVHGYATPGGDPVWKCSECGKGIRVYGIEAPSYNRDYTDGHQWVACPNCGARME